MTIGEWIGVAVSFVVVALFFSAFLFKGGSSESSQTARPENNTGGGVVIDDITVGDGKEAKTSDTIMVHYVGTLQDGTKFDSSRDRDSLFEVTLGAGQVIKGWEEGLVGMKVGGKRKLTIPPGLAYGANGVLKPGSASGEYLIPPNSTLIFEVELLDIK